MKRKLIILLLTVSLSIGSAIPALAVSQELSDTAGHWAQEDIEQAVAAGWVNGYPDGTFRPDNTITRAEFVKMLMAAIHLTPGSDTAEFLTEQRNPALDTALTDMSNSWLTAQGWTLPALCFGLIVPDDYSEHKFGPDTPITRYEIAVMVDRALGLVYPSSQQVTEELTFSDKDQIPEWAQGYVKEAVEAEVLEGYPDGSFGGSRTATRAEAVVMVARALQYMKTGIDKDIKVIVKEPGDSATNAPIEADLTVPVQIIDGCIYVPVRCIFDAIDELYYNVGFNYYWNPVEQTLRFEYGQFYHTFRSGDNKYAMNGSYQDMPGYTFPGNTRLLYGEIMIAAYDLEKPDTGNLWRGNWNSETKTLTLPVGEVKWCE